MIDLIPVALRQRHLLGPLPSHHAGRVMLAGDDTAGRKPKLSALFAALLFALVFVAAPPALAVPALPPQIEAQNGPEHLADPALEARAVALQKELRCLVCQGESLDESNADLAKDLRRLIRKKILEGASNDAIKAYLVSRYGDFILMKPPLTAETYGLWFGPLAVLLVAGAVAAVVVIRARARARSRTD